jgi:hypothetical protein
MYPCDKSASRDFGEIFLDETALQSMWVVSIHEGETYSDRSASEGETKGKELEEFRRVLEVCGNPLSCRLVLSYNYIQSWQKGLSDRMPIIGI